MESSDTVDVSISTSPSASSTNEACDAHPGQEAIQELSPYFPHDILELELSKQSEEEPERCRTRKRPSRKLRAKPTVKCSVKRSKKPSADKSRRKRKRVKVSSEESEVIDACPLCCYCDVDVHKETGTGRCVYPFPKDPEYRTKWTDICRRIQPGFTPSKKSYICEMHFGPEHMHGIFNKRSTKNPVYRLKNDAVPLMPHPVTGQGLITGLPQVYPDGLDNTSPASPEVSLIHEKESVCPGIYCEDCAEFSEEPCWFHTTYVDNTPVVPLALASLPDCLTIDLCPDSCEKGVFTKNELEAQTVFGPMIGALCSTSSNRISPFACEDKSGYGIFKQFHMDSDDCCNWMRYVRFADNKKEQNLMACVKNDEIVFVTSKNVRPGEELKVWYSRSYAKMVKEPRRRPEREYERQDTTNLVILVTPDNSHFRDEMIQSAEIVGPAADATLSDGIIDPAADAQVNLDEQELQSNLVPNRAPPRRSTRLRSNTPKIKTVKRLPQKSKLGLILSQKEKLKLPITYRTSAAGAPTSQHETQPVSFDLHNGEPSAPVPDVPIIEKQPRKRWKDCRKARKDPTSVIKHPCLVCFRHFPSERTLDLHRHEHSKGANGTARDCPECEQVFDTFRKLLEHVKTHGTKYVPREKCAHCGDFISLRGMDPHMRRSHPEHFVEGRKTFPCPLCEEILPSCVLLAAHRSEKHTFCRQCIICAKMFTYTIGLNRHVLTHKEPDGFHCKMCPQIFPSYRLMKTHHRRHHDISDLQTCTVCQKTLRNQHALSLHMHQHSNDYNYKCDICDKTFNHPSVLMSHKREIHDPDVRERKRQRYLEKVITGQRKKYVNPRQVMQYEDFPFKCTICRQGFMVEGKLTRHQLRLHSEPDGSEE